MKSSAGARSKCVVLVGNKISPGNPIDQAGRHGGAYALGRAGLPARRQEGLRERIQADDERATSPGDALRDADRTTTAPA